MRYLAGCGTVHFDHDCTKLATKYQVHICSPDIAHCNSHTGPRMLCNHLLCSDSFPKSRYAPRNPGYCLGNAMHAVRTQCARSAKFWMSANTRTLVLAPFHKFLVPYQGFFGFPSIWDVAYLNCQPFPPTRGPSTKCIQSTRPGSRRRRCLHCSEPRIRRGGSIRPTEYSSGQIVRVPKPWSTSR